MPKKKPSKKPNVKVINPSKKKNRRDITERNLDAQKKRNLSVTQRLKALEVRVSKLEKGSHYSSVERY